MSLIKEMIDNIIHNTIYQSNHCRYHVFLHKKISNGDDNMSLIKYNFFQNTAPCSIKKHHLWGWKTKTYSPTYHLVKLDLQSKCFYKF